MKIYSYALLLAFLLIGLFSGCSEQKEPKPFTYSRLLTGATSKTWRMSSVRYFENGTLQPINLSCAYDDLYTFYNDGLNTFEYRAGGAGRCNAAEPDLVQDTWSLVNATASLTFAIPVLTGDFTYPFIIRSLTENTMSVDIFFEGDTAGYRFVFTAQKEG